MPNLPLDRRGLPKGPALLFLGLIFFLFADAPARAAVPVVEPGDTNLSVLVTGGIVPLISRVLTIDIASDATGGVVELDLGFATQESGLGGTLVDSMTVMLLNGAESAGAILLVLDASGAVWAPAVPGTVLLPPGEPVSAAIDLPEIRMGLPGLTAQFAYHLAVRVPAALWGPQVKLALDVFDYPNGLTSVAWSGTPSFVADIIPPCAPPPAGLAAWWPAENAMSDPTGGHHGNAGAGAGFAAGRVGRAFSLDGTDQSFIAIPSAAALSAQAGFYPPAGTLGGEVSIEAWIRAGSLPSLAEGWRTVAAKAGEYELALGSAGQVRFTVWDADGASATAEGGAVSAGAWQHVAGTFRQGEFLRVYVEGGRVGTEEFPLIVGTASGAPLFFGRRDAGTIEGLFRGEIDEVSLCHHALTDADVAAVHAAGVSGKCDAPLKLCIERGESTVKLRWLRAAGVVVLEQSDSLGVGANWAPGPVIPNLSGEDRLVEVPAESPAKFYRLRR